MYPLLWLVDVEEAQVRGLADASHQAGERVRGG